MKKHQEILERISTRYDWHPRINEFPIPISSQNVYEQITRASKESGIKFTPNDLRETGARRLFEPEAFHFIKSRKPVYKI